MTVIYTSKKSKEIQEEIKTDEFLKFCKEFNWSPEGVSAAFKKDIKEQARRFSYKTKVEYKDGLKLWLFPNKRLIFDNF